MKKNVARIIDYLILVNSNFNKDELEYLIDLQSKIFEIQLQNRINGNFIYDVENFDRIISENYRLADVHSEGIIKQFPERFE